MDLAQRKKRSHRLTVIYTKAKTIPGLFFDCVVGKGAVSPIVG